MNFSIVYILCSDDWIYNIFMVFNLVDNFGIEGWLGVKWMILDFVQTGFNVPLYLYLNSFPKYQPMFSKK